MFRNVLVPVNLSEREPFVVRAAVPLVDREHGRVTLLHVIEEVEGLTDGEAESFYRSLRERAEKTLEGLARDVTGLRSAVQREVVVGRRATTIVRRAEELDCDLIVVGAHKIDPDAPTKGLWTTSQKVALLASKPVLLVR